MDWVIYFRLAHPDKSRWITYAFTRYEGNAEEIIKAFARRYGGSWQARQFRGL